MTLEKLLGMSGDDWEKLSDAELEQWAQRFYHITRPSLDKIPIESKPSKPARAIMGRQSANKNMTELLKFATQMGVEIPKELKK